MSNTYQVNYNGLNIGVDTDYFISGNEGLYSPAIRTASNNLTDQDGGVIWQQKYAPRQIGFTGTLVGDDADAYFANIDALVQAFKILGADSNMTITLWDTLGTQKIIPARVILPPQPVERTGEKDITKFRIVMYCGNPFFLDPTLQEFSVGLSTSVGSPLSIPMNFPIGGVSVGQFTIQNDGDIPAFAKFIISEDVVNPVVTNVTTGKSFQITDTLIAGDEVEIFRDQEGFKVLKNGLNAKSSFSGTFFEIAVGANTIKFSSTGSSVSVTLEAEFRNHYLTIYG